ncbi:MAG: CYTH domain-containing protein [Candidatus Parcubacteria bacterium]|nr:CYTH domain-containing protein [Candidatus Parcubacteria bacterium]
MEIEYEATFTNIDKEVIREKLKNAGAHLERAEFLQKRAVFHLPKGHEITGGWARVRDEGDKITMSVKIIDGDKITNQKEICLIVDSFEEGVNFLKILGCKEKAYQETKRELWKIDGTEVTIDEWPFLEPLVEIEGKDEKTVRDVSEKLGFDWSSARFCCSGTLFAEKYHFSEDVFNNQTPKLIFEMENPFL